MWPDFRIRMKQRPFTYTSTSLFVLINGLVLSALAFIVLSHYMVGQKEMEARQQSNEIVQAVEYSLSEAENAVKALAEFYSGLKTLDRIETMAAPIFTATHPEAILWTGDKGSFLLKKRQDNRDISKTPETGWPKFQDLYREAERLQFGETSYWGNLPWPVFIGRERVGLVRKVRTIDKEVAILLLVYKPEDLFSRNWTVQQSDILRVTVSNHEVGDIIVDKKSLAYADIQSAWIDPVEVKSVLALGGRLWDVRILVQPTIMVRFLTTVPLMSACIIFLLSLIGSFVLDRKRKQDLQLQKLSKTLAGAHHELQTKTSERDKLLEVLKKSEREHKALINSVSDVIFETDEKGYIFFLNETWGRITAYEAKDFIGKSIFDLFSTSEREAQREMFEGLVRGQRQSYRTEATLDLNKGLLGRSVEVAFSMLRMTEDKSLRVVGTITDIEKRHRAEMAMREAEQRYRAIFENSVSGIYQLSPDGKFINANPACAEILGYSSSEELIANVINVDSQIYIQTDARRDFIQKLLVNGRVSWHEAEVYHKNGKKIWIMENARVVRSEKGGILYYEGSMLDVTERKKAEEAMHQARLQAEIASRSRMEFISNMSHELRTPLNAIIGFSELINKEAMGKMGVPVYKEYAQDIYDSGHTLLKTLNEILEISKIDTGQRDLHQTNLKVQDIFQSCLNILSSKIDKSGVNVGIEIAETLPELLAEEIALKQIILNLVGNALKFTPSGGQITAIVQMEASGEMRVSIHDTGIGMTEGEQQKALQPFGRVDGGLTAAHAGTGLGLTLVDSLIRLHGGQFELKSQKGIGTVVSIIFPAYRVLRMGNVTPFKALK